MPTYPSAFRAIGNAALDLYGAWRSRRYDISQTIGVFCTGRGGSTWLAQMLAAAPRHHMLWEPLHWKTDPGARASGFGEPRYIPQGTDHPQAEKHIAAILRGERISHLINSQRYFRPFELLRVQSYVVKFVTANMMLPWMCDTFPIQAVHMVRHPCAVVSSQMEHGAWDELTPSFVHHPLLFEHFPRLVSVFESLNKPEEILAFNWAIQNWVPLSTSYRDRWVTVTYEQLIEQPEEEVDRVFDELGKQTPEAAYRMLNVPSATTVSSNSHEQQLSKWKRKLNNDQVNRVLSVVHGTGITGYTEEVLPSNPIVHNQKK